MEAAVDATGAEGSKGLEQFPSRLNREGFPNQLGCDSSCMLVEEASMHGPSAIVGSSQTCCRRRR